jgi:hypothetical protein
MARLKRAKDGHLYILAGQSQGTWQIGEQGEQWLLQNHYEIPTEYDDEGVSIDHGTFSRLKREGYLYIYDIPYDHNGRDDTLDTQEEYKRAARGLPLLLQCKAGKNPAWELYLDLSVLSAEVWEELRSHQNDFITASNALLLFSWRKAVYAEGLLRVYPFPRPYQIFSSDAKYHKQLLRQAPETPGLLENWQGNVFTERTTQKGTWQRCVPNSVVSFTGELLWLAKVGCNPKPDWPGQAVCIGKPRKPFNGPLGWQLWLLSVNEDTPVSWDAIKCWFKDRSIDVAPLHQRLEIISPPSSITKDGQYLIGPGQSIWIACYPPQRHLDGIFRDISLSAELIDSTDLLHTTSSKSLSASCPANRVNYFRWSANQTGDYRIRIHGDASAEPLHIRVSSLPFKHPAWLHGLSCTFTIGEDQQTFHAFKDDPDSAADSSIGCIDWYAQQELAELSWTYEPQGLPISVSWHYTTSKGQPGTRSGCFVQSGGQLTWFWREKICPLLTEDTQLFMIFDAGSFGSIKIPPITLPRQPLEPMVQIEIDEQMTAQLSWLSRMIREQPGQRRVPLPPTLREMLLQLYVKSNRNVILQSALEKLASATTIPTWLFYRLRALLIEKEHMQTLNNPPYHHKEREQ